MPNLRELYGSDYQRNANLKHHYGITLDDYNRMLEEQENCCAICGGQPVGNRQVFFVDHCHDTKKVRGLLCANCNHGLSKFKDNLALLKKAVEYLENAEATDS